MSLVANDCLVLRWNDKLDKQSAKHLIKVHGLKKVVVDCRETYTDLEMLRGLGLEVVKTPSFAEHSVAELGVLFTLLFARCTWTKSTLSSPILFFKNGLELQGKQGFIIGCEGAIGQALEYKLTGLGINALGWDKANQNDDQERFDRWSKYADFIYVCIPLKGNEKFFSKKFFDNLERKPFIINLARPELFPRQLVLWALKKNLISGYGVDGPFGDKGVFYHEIISTEHVGANTVEARKRQLDFVKKETK